jgi:hypothetical protein
MEMPNHERAVVAREKLTHYLLSNSHPVGKSKAKFFRQFGYDDQIVELLEEGLLAIAQTQEVEEVEESAHGTKYKIPGFLNTPAGIPVRILTVWIIPSDGEDPRFVTAFPS